MRILQMQQEMIERGARGLGIKVVFVEGDEKIKDSSKRYLQATQSLLSPRDRDDSYGSREALSAFAWLCAGAVG